MNINHIISQEEIDGPLVFVDTETTGFNHESDKILEIAIVRVNKRQIIDTTHYYIDPGENFSIPKESSDIHGITNQKMQKMRNNRITGNDGPKAYLLDDVIEDIYKKLNNSIFIAHNAEFDLKFIRNAMNQYTHSIPPLSLYKVVDTVGIGKLVIPRGRLTLDALCQKFSIDKSERAEFHGALVDTKLLVGVFFALVDATMKRDLFEDVAHGISASSPQNITQDGGIQPAPKPLRQRKSTIIIPSP